MNSKKWGSIKKIAPFSHGIEIKPPAMSGVGTTTYTGGKPFTNISKFTQRADRADHKKL
jgi:hypothetical protein